jgi:hypothetical protein
VREKLHGALKTAFATGRTSKATDLLGALDRIPAGGARRTAVIFFSDMLNTTPECNMERRAAPALIEAGGLARRLAAGRGWDQRRLAGVGVYCVLSSVESGEHAFGWNRTSVRGFYTALFESLGASVRLFDTHFGDAAF